MSPAGLLQNSVDMLGVPWLTERESAALILVAVSLLFFRAFRERYLLVWAAGWTAYGAFLVLRANDLDSVSKSMAAITHVDFVFAIALLASAALIAAQSWRVLTAVGA